MEPEVRDVVEELVELVAEEERQASVASASPPVVQAPKSFLGAQWILMESCLLEMQEIKKQFVAEKARAHALQQDLAVQKDKVASLEQEREEEAQAARREAQMVQRDLSVRTTELNTLREKLAEAEQVASSQRLRDQQEINAIREQLRAREEITPVRENQPREEQAAKSARETCVICGCLDRKTSMAACQKGHAVCKSCFESYADTEMSNGQQRIRCPFWPAHLAGCTRRFSEQNVAQILSANLHERYMRGMREQIRAEEYQKTHQVVQRIASALEAQARVPGISQKMLELLSQETLEQQLKQSCKGARQCGNCHFGPVMHHKCSDLRSHHEKDGYNNRCPHCGWFAEHISDWPPWNGKVSSAAFVTPTSNVDIAKPSADPSAGSEESQDIAEPSADPSAGSEESQTHPGCISRGAFTWLVPRWWRERNDAALVHRSASVER